MEMKSKQNTATSASPAETSTWVHLNFLIELKLFLDKS